MARVSSIITNFRAGEISPKLEGRIDLQKYNEATQTLNNMLVYPSGGVTRRPGTYFAGRSKDGGKVRLTNFEFSDEQAYVLEFGASYIRFYKDGGLLTESVKTITGITKASPAVVTSNGHGFSNGDRVFIASVAGMTEVNNREFTVASTATNTFALSGVNSSGFTTYGSGGTAGKIVEVATPYSATEIFELNYTQSADVMYLAHKSHEPAKLTRTTATSFTIGDIDFVDGPYLDENVTTTTLYASAQTGSGITITASANLFTSADVGRYIRFREVLEVHYDEWAASTSYANNAKIRFNGHVYKHTTGNTQTSGNTPPVHLEGSEVYGALTWEYQHDANGYVVITGFTNTTVVTGTVKTNAIGITKLPEHAVGSSNATTKWSLGAFNGDQGFPRAVGFYEQRLYLAGTTGQPQTIFGSVSADFENHTPGTLDDDAVNLTISSDKVNVIRHLLPARFLQILTTSSEFTLSGGTGSQPVTPTNVNVLRETTFGTSDIRPVRAGNSTILVQKGQEKVKEITFNLDTDGLLGIDLTILADHIPRGGLTDMVWQQEPELILWFVHSDGRLVGLTYDRANAAVGWHDHNIGGTSAHATITVSDYTNIATGTTLAFTKSNGETITFTSEAAGGTSPASTLGFRPNESNNTTADNIFTAVNAHADFVVENPAAAVVTIREIAPAAGGVLTIKSSDRARLTTTDEVRAIVESITSIPSGAEDQVYVSVKRVIDGSTVRHVEFIKTIEFGNDVTDAFFIDSGLTYDGAATSTISGLNHLEGEVLSILADGATHPLKTVSAGAITLERAASKVHVGYGYTSVVETLRLEAGADDGIAQGKIKRIHGVTARFFNTVGAELGPDTDNLDRLPFRDSSMAMDEAVPLFNGDKEIYFPSGYETDARVVVRQSQPLPMTLLAIMRRSNTFDA
tara:strand:- start:1775 stop:4519 length:2745 start_codon:yes stop_codon:yes gene_type:complete